MLERAVAEGIHRIEDAHTNFYLVEDGGQVTIVDTGLPRSWGSLISGLRELGHSLRDVSAVVLTHAHYDHMGFARRAQHELDVPVWIHPDDRWLAAHPWRFDHERPIPAYLRHPEFIKVFTEMGAMGALWVKGTDAVTTYNGGDALDVPGRPTVIPTPGHTHGHCALYFADRGAVIAGDAFVMLDPYTGRTGPCIVAGGATADSARALSSLDAIAGLDANVGLTGHGPALTGRLAAAADAARAAGPA